MGVDRIACPGCGEKENPARAHFCLNCGATLSADRLSDEDLAALLRELEGNCERKELPGKGSVSLEGSTFEITSEEVRLPGGGVVTVSGGTTGIHNDCSNDYFGLSYKPRGVFASSGRLEIYERDADVASIEAVYFNGNQIYYEVQGPGGGEEVKGDGKAARRWADQLLVAAGLPTGALVFTEFVNKVLRGRGYTAANLYNV